MLRGAPSSRVLAIPSTLTRLLKPGRLFLAGQRKPFTLQGDKKLALICTIARQSATVQYHCGVEANWNPAVVE
jgi:hypothetical protein